MLTPAYMNIYAINPDLAMQTTPTKSNTEFAIIEVADGLPPERLLDG